MGFRFELAEASDSGRVWRPTRLRAGRETSSRREVRSGWHLDLSRKDLPGMLGPAVQFLPPSGTYCEHGRQTPVCAWPTTIPMIGSMPLITRSLLGKKLNESASSASRAAVALSAAV